MVTDNNFFVKTFVLFFVVVCVVVAEHQKRDVHRIILQHRVPRNHNKGHAHNHGRKQEPKYKKAKLELPSQELYSNSFEDSGSYSNENSFENYHHQKSHKHSTKKLPKSHRHHIYTNLDVQESRNHPHKKLQSFYNEWLPVNYDHLTSNVFSQINREKDKPKRQSKKNIFRNIVPEDFDVFTPNLPHHYINPYKQLTTSHNLNSEQSFKKGIPYESSTLYPPIDVLSTFSELNKKTLESNNTSITFDDNIQKDTLNALKNHNIINYDDNNNDSESSDKDLEGYIVVPEKSEIISSENIHNKLNSKNRGGSIRFNQEFQN